MSNIKILTEQLLNDVKDNFENINTCFKTKERFNKKRKLSNWDIAEGILLSINTAFSLQKTWNDGKQLINEIQNPKPVPSQNHRFILVFIGGQMVFLPASSSGEIPTGGFLTGNLPSNLKKF